MAARLFVPHRPEPSPTMIWFGRVFITILGRRSHLRSARSFRRYHLPYARHIPPEVLGEATGLQGVKVVVYARNAALPEEAWLVLKQIGVEGAYYLEGGLDGWRRRILFPNLTSIVGMTEEEVEAVQRISRYFGGRPIGMEKAGASSAGKYRREGC